jgi:hypothetical protein
LIFISLVFGLELTFLANQIKALDVVSNNANHVTASVKDHTVPSSVILIAPANASQVVTKKPTFVWYGATDDIGVSYYQVFIDGVVFLNTIPITSTSNSSYVSVVDGIGNTLSVTPKTSLADGIHSWKVMVFDAAGNSNTSATWSFTIDSQAPSFILVQIGDINTDISALDSSTWPTSIIEVTENPTRLFAFVEHDSQIKATVSWDGVIKQTINTNSGSGGFWIEFLGVVPRDKDVTLNFLITDSFDLTTILENVKFKVVDKLTIPSLGTGLTPTVTPKPTLLPGEPSPTPSEIIPTPTEISTAPTPAPVPTKKPIVALITGVLDWNWPGGQTATKTTIPWVQEVVLKITLNLPDKIAEPLQQIVTTPPSSQPFWWSLILPILYLMLLSLVWLWWYWNWRKSWLTAGLVNWWAILGWLRPKAKGILLNFEVNQTGNIIGPGQPLKLAKILVMARTTAMTVPLLIETIFSDQNGQFSLPQWPSSKLTGANAQYSLKVVIKTDQGEKTLDFSPQLSNWPPPFTPYVYWHHQYYGGWLSLKRGLNFPDLMVITQTKTAKIQNSPNLTQRIGLNLTSWAQIKSNWLPFLIIVGLLVSSIWGGWLNWLSLFNLSLIGCYRIYLKNQFKYWQINLPEKAKRQWYLVTSPENPLKAWWGQSDLAGTGAIKNSLKITVPHQIQKLKISPIASTLDQEKFCPDAWQIKTTTTQATRTLTDKIECIL